LFIIYNSFNHIQIQFEKEFSVSSVLFLSIVGLIKLGGCNNEPADLETVCSRTFMPVFAANCNFPDVIILQINPSA
jgi:hypothetical protein